MRGGEALVEVGPERSGAPRLSRATPHTSAASFYFRRNAHIHIECVCGPTLVVTTHE